MISSASVSVNKVVQSVQWQEMAKATAEKAIDTAVGEAKDKVVEVVPKRVN
jgi:hypothetical protein